MFDLTYYKYIFNILKNTISPVVIDTLFNPHLTYLHNRQSAKDKYFSMNANNDFSISFFSSYEYLNEYINEYIKYFNIDTTLYMRLYKYNMVITD